MSVNIDKLVTKAAKGLVKEMNKALDDALPGELAEIVKGHSLGAAAAGVASGWIPGAGGLAVAGISAGFVWTMYGRINSRIGLPMSENVIKSLATGVATNLASYVVGGIVMSAVFSLIPGLGSVGASVVAGGTCYGLTLASGVVYMKLLTALFSDGRDPTGMDADGLKEAAKKVASREEVKTMISSARSAYVESEKKKEKK